MPTVKMRYAAAATKRASCPPRPLPKRSSIHSAVVITFDRRSHRPITARSQHRPSPSPPREARPSSAPFTGLQCAEGWCMTACPVDAITIGPVDAKIVLDDQCVGCKLCTIACPYGTMFYDRDTRKATKCDLCGGDPACADACPTQAILWVEGEPVDWLGDFAASRTGMDLEGRAATGGR